MSFYFLNIKTFRIDLDLQKTSHMSFTQFPLLFTSDISIVYLSQLVNQY